MIARRNSRPARSRRAFTLMEILLALAILVILAGTGTLVYVRIQKQANVDAAKNQIHSFESCMEKYHLDVGAYPSSLQDLRNPPANVAKWQGPYIDKEVLEDPWGRAYHYQVDGTGDGYELYSSGPDGVAGNADDIGHKQ